MIAFSEPKSEIVAALFTAQKSMGPVKKNAVNPAFRSKYADLAATLDGIDPALEVAKLIVVQAPITAPDGAIGVETMLLHASGEWMRAEFYLPLAKADAQGAGSAITYARRYALMALFSIAAEDDDANEAAGRQKRAEIPRARPQSVLDTAPEANALLLLAVEKGAIPTADRILFKEFARTKVRGCEKLDNAAPLTIEQRWAIKRYFDAAS